MARVNYYKVRNTARIVFIVLAVVFFIVLFVNTARGSEYRHRHPLREPVSFPSMRMMSLRPYATGGRVEHPIPAILACLSSGYVIPTQTWDRVKRAGNTPTNPTTTG